MRTLRHQRGYLLVSIVVTMFLLASIAMMLNYDSAASANATSRELEAAQAEYLAQAAMRHAVWKANQSACSSYALPVTGLGAHSYSAAFTPSFGSPTEIAVIGTHASGIERRRSRPGVTVYDGATPVVGMLVPGHEGKDTFIEGGIGHQDHNKGGDNALSISSEDSNEERVLLQFDLSGLPAKAIVQSATLEITASSINSFDVVEVHRLLSSWVEDEVTWQNRNNSDNWSTPGGDFNTDVVGTFYADSIGAYTTDITDLVNAWISGAVPNYGVILRSPQTVDGKSNAYHSSDDTNSPRPRLMLTYVCECGAPCPGIAVAHSVVLSTDSDATLGGLDFTDVDVVAYDAATDTAALRFDGQPTSLTKDIDAVHVLESGHIVMSAKDDAQLGGLSFRADDLIEYDPVSGAATMFFDGSQHFSEDEDIVSLHVLRSGHLILSTSSDATLGGVTFNDNDLVRYDPASRSTSIFLDGDTVGLTPDIAALHVLQNGRIVLAANEDTTLGGLSFTTADLVEYDQVADTAIMYFAGSSLFGDSNEKIISAHVDGDLGPLGYILLVAGDAAAPSDKDTARQDLFESWGYVVRLIDDAATAVEFSTQAARSDVVYVSGSIDPVVFAGKLTGSSSPFVNESSALIADLGFSAVEGVTATHRELTFIDPGHYITESLASSTAALFASDTVMPVVPGPGFGDTQALGAVSTPLAPALAALYTGAERWDGAPADTRRVQVPFENADIGTLSADGLTLLRRSIEWASGEGCDYKRKLLLVVSDDSNPSTSEVDRQTLFESWCNRVTLIDDSEAQSVLEIAALANDVVYVSGEVDPDELEAKLRSTARGTVVEEEHLFQEFGFSSAFSNKYRSEIDVVDNGHYITSGFPTGLLTVLTSDQWSGMVINLAPGAESLALLNDNGPAWKPSLAVVEVGGEIYGGDIFGGGVAAGRRVKLPWANYDVNTLNDAGRTITRRAIEWAEDGNDSLSTGPIAHWKLDETGGTTAVDSAGGNDGTLINGPSWVTGTLDGGLSFDGSNDYIDVSSMNPGSYDDFTLSAWYKSADSSVSDDEYIYMHAEGFITEGLTFGPTDDSGDSDRLRLTIDIGNVADEHYGTSDIVDQQWHHLVAVRWGGRIVLYVDNIQESNNADAHAGNSVAVDGEGPFIGDYPGGTEQVHGILDDVRLYDRGLNVSEIAALFAAGGTGGGGGGGGSQPPIFLSTTTDATFGGVTFGDDDLAEYDSNTDLATMHLDGNAFSRSDEDINAAHLLPDGTLLLSTTGNATLGGLSFGDDDLVLYDPATDSGTLVLDGAAFSASTEDIDAVHKLTDSKFILSTETDATIGGISVGDDDLFIYDTTQGTATLYFDGANFSSSDEDINAISLLSNGNMLISTTADATLGGLSFGDDDIVEYDPSTGSASLYLDGNIFNDSDEDIDAISIRE